MIHPLETTRNITLPPPPILQYLTIWKSRAKAGIICVKKVAIVELFQVQTHFKLLKH